MTAPYRCPFFVMAPDDGEHGLRSKVSELWREIADLVAARTSPAVKAALKELLEAPMAAGSGTRMRRARS